MATMTIRIPDAKHQRLRRMAERQGISLNKLVEEWANVALAQHDTEAPFEPWPPAATPVKAWRSSKNWTRPSPVALEVSTSLLRYRPTVVKPTECLRMNATSNTNRKT